MQDDGEAAPAAPRGRHARLQTAKRVAVEEFRRYVIAFLCIWLLLAMFAMHEPIALRARGIVPLVPHRFALVNALVLAKVALVAEHLRWGCTARRWRPACRGSAAAGPLAWSSLRRVSSWR